jgi:hypothetical protein
MRQTIQMLRKRQILSGLVEVENRLHAALEEEKLQLPGHHQPY